MHKDAAAANRKYNEQHCTDDKRKGCPVIGSIDPSFKFPTPRCQKGACVAEAAATAAPDSVDLSGYSKACTTPMDCNLVHAWPCDHCGCPHDAIARSERERYDRDAAKIDCKQHPDTRVCGECMDYTVTCENGVCGAKQ
jgi:hypothetical protein